MSTYVLVLSDWLNRNDYSTFCAQRREGRAFAIPAIAAVEPALFDSALLAQILRGQPDQLIVRDGTLLDLPAAASEAELARRLARGVGLVVRRAQEHASTLAALADRFSQEFACSVQVQLFVTPGQTRGFRWHYDAEDVVILQTVGRKTYSMRENTRIAGVPVAEPDFALIRQETSPLQMCTLAPGGALYLPRGMWHMARADEDSYSISIGLGKRLPFMSRVERGS